MSVGTDKLAAATTLEEVMAVKTVLEIERDNAKKLLKEYTSKSTEARNQASKCRADMHDVETIMKDRLWEIGNQSQGDV